MGQINFNGIIPVTPDVEHLFIKSEPAYRGLLSRLTGGFKRGFYEDVHCTDPYTFAEMRASEIEDDVRKVGYEFEMEESDDDSYRFISRSPVDFSGNLRAITLSEDWPANESYEQTGTRSRKGLFGTKQVPLFTIKPKVRILGQINFKDSDLSKLEGLVGVLQNQQYDVKVVSKEELLQMALMQSELDSQIRTPFP